MHIKTMVEFKIYGFRFQKVFHCVHMHLTSHSWLLPAPNRHIKALQNVNKSIDPKWLGSNYLSRGRTIHTHSAALKEFSEPHSAFEIACVNGCYIHVSTWFGLWFIFTIVCNENLPKRPYSVLFARLITSSSVLNVLTSRTGPKISSLKISASSFTFLKIVGSTK